MPCEEVFLAIQSNSSEPWWLVDQIEIKFMLKSRPAERRSSRAVDKHADSARMAAIEDLSGDTAADAEPTETSQLLDGTAQGDGEESGDGERPRLSRATTKEEIIQTDDISEDGARAVQQESRRPWTQYRRIIFVLGCMMGLVLAWVFRSPKLQLEGLLDSVDMADFFDDLRAALPSTLDVGMVQEVKEIQAHSRERAVTGAFSVGEQMLQKGMSAHYPVVMVRPPFTTNISLASQMFIYRSQE
jgi:hypothetical protein